MADYADLSLWHSDVGSAGLQQRPALDGDTTVDVCVVGAGYTGLWAAYYLLRADPSLHVLVVEAETAGFGASGRNGGWCSALLPQGVASLARDHGLQAAMSLRRTMNATVLEVGDVARAEGIDCSFERGGTVVVARSAAQLSRARAEVAADVRFDGVDGLQLLDAAATRERLGVPDAVGSTYTPHCARLHPARLVRGLADAVERRGGRIVEGTRAVEVGPGVVRTDRGVVRARSVLRAVEAWTARLPGHARDIAPVYSLVIATEPLPETVWDEVGLRAAETFSEHRHLIVYGQRTVDGRLVFGGRGAPYHFGSAVTPEADREPAVFAALRSTLVDLLPAMAPYAVTHSWGGPLGIARDWHASVRYDSATGLGSAGGYVGDGVAASNLAGRTLADLVTGRQTALTSLPWVNHHPRRWEPEPLRWLGINAGTASRDRRRRAGAPHREAVGARTCAGAADGSLKEPLQPTADDGDQRQRRDDAPTPRAMSAADDRRPSAVRAMARRDTPWVWRRRWRWSARSCDARSWSARSCDARRWSPEPAPARGRAR